MRSLPVRCLAFCTIGVLLFAAAGYVGNRISPVYLDPDLAWVAAREPADTPMLVTAGNSHAVAVDFAALGWTGRHLWLSNADGVEAAAVARHAAAVPDVRAILMPVFLPTLHVDHAGRRAEPRLRAYQLMFAAGDLRMLDGDPLGWARWALSYVQRRDRWRGVARAVLCDDPPCTAPYPRDKQWQEADPLGEEAVARVAAELLAIVEPEFAGDARPVSGLAALEEAARAATARGVPLLLFDAPASSAFDERFDRALRRGGRSMEAAGTGFRDWLRDARRRGLCVTHVDMLWDPASDGRNAAFYRDPLHLNPVGAREFSRRLASRLEPLPACPPA